jgi:hypothetical protein
MVFDAGGGGGRRTIERKFSRQGENFAYQNFLINAEVTRMIISYYVIIAYLSLYDIHFHCQNRVLIGKREKKEKK